MFASFLVRIIVGAALGNLFFKWFSILFLMRCYELRADYF